MVESNNLMCGLERHFGRGIIYVTLDKWRETFPIIHLLFFFFFSSHVSKEGIFKVIFSILLSVIYRIEHSLKISFICFHRLYRLTFHMNNFFLLI
jgi:hypothetical protein